MPPPIDAAKKNNPPKWGPPSTRFRFPPPQEVGDGCGDLSSESRFESSEIDVVQVSEIGLVRGIHLVEPVDELVGDLVTERVVELTRQLRGHRHWHVQSNPGTR